MNHGAAAHEGELKRVARKLHLLAQRLQVAQAERDEAIQKSRDVLSRRRVAKLTGMTPGRVQQIIDRESQ
jgi:hypothetical protein